MIDDFVIRMVTRAQNNYLNFTNKIIWGIDSSSVGVGAFTLGHVGRLIVIRLFDIIIIVIKSRWLALSATDNTIVVATSSSSFSDNTPLYT